ncbi:uncharacterized protein RHIMIDRAFT_240895 [Rhizopus microsporus ATCC 52813]|uniref:Uncharacterized protein n=2 Tax=Rhizopus microsporus TaxID=58291 RepID=A0A2G4SEL2_RHIZD|nr:uncharacterized protein RHIMIDRAFT_242872 [Rhizopus microsporus ATCC 52813]XP_023463097.1 uncharacterized protein RHIMIDRAFT_240895 [Rhizopus microsporus ATCC 52813]PHZ07227.1 hypothetical protein RHIMIDRAFT_242872 [Rhizopus microsporus ATCC 52813]PHZ09389.1 hypothetical protein RHIMIDRAFT_240895 [Rhizopus microsporus ATCC 52813]
MQRFIKPPPQQLKMTLVQRRMYSNRPLIQLLMRMTPTQRRIALFGTGIAATLVLGPFLLVGLGGIAAVGAFQFWKLKRQLNQAAIQQQPLSVWSDLFANYYNVPLSRNSVLQEEALKRVEDWAQTDHGRSTLMDHGIRPDDLTSRAYLRGTSSTSIMVQGITQQRIKLEFDLRDCILLVFADQDSSIKDVQLVNRVGHALHIPLTVQQQRTGRVIEGEFHDIK